MEKYLEGEALTEDEINSGIKTAVLEGDMIPVVSVSALNLTGVDRLLDMIVDLMPSPLDSKRDAIDPAKPVSVFVFKTIADPYVGKLSMFKVMSGLSLPGWNCIISTKTKKKK